MGTIPRALNWSREKSNYNLYITKVSLSLFQIEDRERGSRKRRGLRERDTGVISHYWCMFSSL